MNIFVRCPVIAIAASTAALSAQALTVVVGGGLQGDGAIKAFVEPFEKETGIKVNVVRDQATTASVKLKAQSGNMDFDVAGFSPAGGTILSRSALLEPVDYARFNKGVIDRLSPVSRKAWGVQFI